ncbi:MAG: lipoprotein signal peptidase [Candidatus Symbiothrix sp.]|jgi:signal peptidase II|nr:lipoprotein signal peptidase [Candidatus Symbiothrix sp.]
MRSKGVWAILVVLLILFSDQFLKIWIKTHLPLGESGDVKIAGWFIIRFVENPGMAMGIEVVNKLFLSLFRMGASLGIAWYIVRLIKRDYDVGYIVCCSMIFAGAVGNIIDSVFYGVIFSESTPYTVATLFPADGGYATWLHGKVVDMFYFPLFEFQFPDWIPFVGGNDFVFFQYIFNLADASITTGIAILILFYNKTFAKSFEKQ